MKRLDTLIILLFVALCAKGQMPQIKQPTKISKLRRQADIRYDRMHFLKATELYKEVMEFKKIPEVELRLANCYRELNLPAEAAFWYGRAENDGAEFSKENSLDYAFTLLATEQYNAAKKRLMPFRSSDPWVTDHILSIDSFSMFYQDQYAYQVSWEPYNSSEKDFSPTFVNEQLVFVSARESLNGSQTFHWDGTRFLDLYQQEDEHQVRGIEGDINSSYHEGPASFWDNGSKVIFTRNSYTGSRMKLTKKGVNNLHLYYAEKRPSGHWRIQGEFPYNSEEYSVGHPSITEDGKTLYFASDMPGGYGGVDLYKSEYKYDRWETPVNLGPKINTPRDELFPYIRESNVLYFASDGHKGMGGLDIFRVNLSKGTPVYNLGFPINTSSDDFGLCFRPKTEQAYFSSNRPGGMGGDDIYSVLMADYAVEVVLVDEKTGEPITTPGRIDLLRTLRSQMNSPGISIAATQIRFGVEGGTSFLVTGSADGYFQGNLIIQLAEEKPEEVKHLYYEIPMKRTHIDQEAEIIIIVNNEQHTQQFYTTNDVTTPFQGRLSDLRGYLDSEGYTVVKETYLSNIYYDFDQSVIRPDAAFNLDKLVKHLATDVSLNIVLEAHTDVRGSNQYNQLLANRRVDSARKYLIDSGIDPDRIYTGSHGEEQTFIDCQDCSEEQHQSNRRTEIRIEINKVGFNQKLTSVNR